ncbi:MAG: hypothetical protein E7629_09025 [Ruminococcaceae bacterium]|nr:hypothetical protein [Oscillospiraceae bacterium]
MKDLSSYVPESLHTQRKRQKPSRVFFEDLAVVEPGRNFRILASRGKALPVGVDFFTACGVLASDAAQVRSHPACETRFLLPCKGGCVLLLGDLSAETGLMVGILLRRTANETLCALKRIGQFDFLTPSGLFSKDAPACSRCDETLCLQLEELFYYLERILRFSPESSLWTKCLLISNLVGCRLERVALPLEAPPLSVGDCARMTMFLICSFLELRQKSGKVLTEGTEESPNYRCTVSFLEESESLLTPEEEDSGEKQATKTPLFLEASCFDRLTATLTRAGMQLETRFPIVKDAHALGATPCVVWIKLCFGIFPAFFANGV